MTTIDHRAEAKPIDLTSTTTMHGDEVDVPVPMRCSCGRRLYYDYDGDEYVHLQPLPEGASYSGCWPVYPEPTPAALAAWRYEEAVRAGGDETIAEVLEAEMAEVCESLIEGYADANGGRQATQAEWADMSRFAHAVVAMFHYEREAAAAGQKPVPWREHPAWTDMAVHGPDGWLSKVLDIPADRIDPEIGIDPLIQRAFELGWDRCAAAVARLGG